MAIEKKKAPIYGGSNGYVTDENVRYNNWNIAEKELNSGTLSNGMSRYRKNQLNSATKKKKISNNFANSYRSVMKNKKNTSNVGKSLLKGGASAGLSAIMKGK